MRRAISHMNEDDSSLHHPLGIPTLSDLGDIKGASVLVRGDLDLGKLDPASPAFLHRLDTLVPTLRWLVDRGAAVTVCGHMGDLDAKAPESVSVLSSTLKGLVPGISVMDNLAGDRERLGAADLAAQLVEGQDLYVNEAFRWCELPLASIVGPPVFLRSAAGLRLTADLSLLEPFLDNPSRPFVVVFGSHQSASRLAGLRGLILRADAVLVGGAMALPFLQAIGSRPTEHGETELLAECRSCFGLAHEIQHEIHLPTELVWELPDGQVEQADPGSSPGGEVSDIGERTTLRYAEILEGAGSVLWIGALGRAEDPRFKPGTQQVAAGLPEGRHVVLGGDALLSALEDVAMLSKATGLVSAADSAIALLKDGDLPGLKALRESLNRR